VIHEATPPPDPLAESALRGRLFAKDGLEGDRIEGERAFFRAAGEPAPSNVDPAILREVPKGGRYARVHVRVGDRAGNSVVLKRAGIALNGGRLWFVTCGGCGELQVRDSGRINFARRHRREILCPDCIIETNHGLRMARAAALLERVRAGGPIWTGGEILSLQEGVQRDLEAEFGEIEDTDDIGMMQIAVGFPSSSGEPALRPDNQHEIDQPTKQEAKENAALGTLASAIASEDAEIIQQADSDLRRVTPLDEPSPEEYSYEQTARRAHEHAESMLRVSRAKLHCLWCSQMFCGNPMRDQCCSSECDAKLAKLRRSKVSEKAQSDKQSLAKIAPTSESNRVVPAGRPIFRHGDLILGCDHARANKAMYVFQFLDLMPFSHPNGLNGLAKWLVMCRSCFDQFENEPLWCPIGRAAMYNEES
jgi:hypothetical protein